MANNNTSSHTHCALTQTCAYAHTAVEWIITLNLFLYAENMLWINFQLSKQNPWIFQQKMKKSNSMQQYQMGSKRRKQKHRNSAAATAEKL